MNRVTGGGYAYIFLKQKDIDNSYMSIDETDVYITGCIYVEKLLDYEDFSTVKLNDSIQQVIAIDHATSFSETIQ